ncbi:MAG TPA: tetratricopeptide repeat protein [Blastocatellia bacterium]|nr:tetratricopeptide repeat protein [Blastocatellia bacterium]
MSTHVSKTSKNRSPASQKLRATKGKKAVSKKPQRPGKIAKPTKSKKTVSAKVKKQAAPAKKPAVTAKKTAPKKKAAKAGAARAARQPARKPAAARKAVSKARQVVVKPPPQRKIATPSTLAAVHAFEHALKIFNRHDFAAARSAFEEVLDKFGEQHEVVARTRTYLAICEQRLARTPSVPRNTDALYDQGVFELNKGNIRKAVEFFDKALKAEPRADHVLYSLAAAYSRLNEQAKALDALRRAISLRTVHRSHARRDLDFAGLHTNEEFQHLTGFGFDFAEE